ncbi:tyrosine-type recombinase/integrase [Methanolobus sp. ZRKC3]|uniref:tyrosine-type recombinase/integrase n=1 Tax=Methanolobus sp. ZRKC3 TaxID=3125786 RepID=UPI0032528591
MVFGDIDAWIVRHNEDASGQGQQIYTTMYEYMLIENLKHHSMTSYLSNFRAIVQKKPHLDYNKLDEASIKEILTSIVKKHKNPTTQVNQKISLRKWLQCSGQEHLLDLVKTKRVKSNSKLPEEMLTKEELELLLTNCSHPRDSAIIALLYDSGCRIGELLSMRVKDVEFDDNGAIVTFPEGKTGWRKNRILLASSYLRVWLDSHEYKANYENPLFYSMKGKYKNPDLDYKIRNLPENKEIVKLTAEAVRRQIHNIAKKAGIERRIHPHLFRHTRATELANHLTEQQLKKQFGWTAGSDVASKYVHLTDKDVERAILKASGIEIEEEVQERGLTPTRCMRCKEINPPHAAFCMKCGYPMTLDAIDKSTSMKQEAINSISMEDIQKMISREIEKMKK